MTVTALGLAGLPITSQGTFAAKTPEGYPAVGMLVEEFDLWREGYGKAEVSIYDAGTTTLAKVYSDPEMTQEAQNPQILLAYVDGSGAEFGKFADSLYVPYAYELDIDASEQTGVIRVPLPDQRQSAWY